MTVSGGILRKYVCLTVHPRFKTQPEIQSGIITDSNPSPGWSWLVRLSPTSKKCFGEGRSGRIADEGKSRRIRLNQSSFGQVYRVFSSIFYFRVFPAHGRNAEFSSLAFCAQDRRAPRPGCSRVHAKCHGLTRVMSRVDAQKRPVFIDLSRCHGSARGTRRNVQCPKKVRIRKRDARFEVRDKEASSSQLEAFQSESKRLKANQRSFTRGVALRLGERGPDVVSRWAKPGF